MKRLFKVFGLFSLACVALSLIAAAPANASASAVQIAVAIIIIAPFAITLISKYIKLDGPVMALIVFVLSVVGAIVAAFISGTVHSTDFSTVPGIVAAATAIFGLSQLIFQTLKDSPVFGKYLK